MVKMRLAWIGYYNFLICIKHQLYGRKASRFKKWKKGDLLVFCIDRGIYGLAEVTGEAFRSADTVWPEKLNPHRIPIKFIHAADGDYGLPLTGAIKHALTLSWGKNFGWAIAANDLLPEKYASFIHQNIISTHNDLEFLNRNIDDLLDQF